MSHLRAILEYKTMGTCVVGNLSAQHFAPFIETIDWNQASAFLESLPVRWCGIDGFNPGVYGLVRNLFIPSTMME
jgi:hypothetical protein